MGEPGAGTWPPQPVPFTFTVDFTRTPTDKTTAVWNPTQILAAARGSDPNNVPNKWTGTSKNDFSITDKGLRFDFPFADVEGKPSNAFGGRMICYLTLGTPELFWATEEYVQDGTLFVPGCSCVRLMPEYV